MVMQAHCPACHKAIEVKPDQAITVCLSCGKVIRIPDDLEMVEGEEEEEEDEQGQEADREEGGGQGGDGSGEEWSAGPGSAEDVGEVVGAESHKGRGFEPGIPEEDMDDEEAVTNEVAEAAEAVETVESVHVQVESVEVHVGEPDGQPVLDALAGAESDESSGALNAAAEDPLEKVPTTRFKRQQQSLGLEDEELLSDIETAPGQSGSGVVSSSVSSVLRFETTCPSCGGLVGVEGAEVPDHITCTHCGAQVDVAGQISAMLQSSGIRKVMSPEDVENLQAWLNQRVEASTGAVQVESSRDESVEAEGKEAEAPGGDSAQQEAAGEDIDVVQTYCPHCKNLVSLDADLLVPGTLCPHCGKPLVPSPTVLTSAQATAQKSSKLLLILISLVILGMGIVLAALMSSSSSRDVSVSSISPVVRGRLALSGSLGDWTLMPTTCRSGQAQGYNGIEVSAGGAGAYVRFVDSAAGKYVLVAKSRGSEPVKIANCDPFVFEMKRSATKVGAHWLTDGTANVTCRDRKTGEILVQGQVWFQRCP